MDAVWLHKESRKSNPKGFAVVVTDADGKHKLHYVLKDHLGSWTTITDADGTVEQELSFDAWGNLRDPNTWLRNWLNPVYEEPMFDRGYTGHEHMTAFGLINMNGRVYDPLMSSFLSVDAFVQSPDNSQCFNRYAYCLNNPLKYTDPSGWQLIGGTNSGNSFNENWGQNYGEKIYTATEVHQMLWTMGISIGNWMAGNEMQGGCSNSGDVKCVFGHSNPNAVHVMGPGACIFASLGEICIRLGEWSLKPKEWKEQEELYYNMKNDAEGVENENNHGYNTNNIVDFVQWVGSEKNIDIIIEPILVKDISDAYNDDCQVLVLVSLADARLIENNGGQTGHASVLNTFRWRKDDSIEMTFGDPSPVRVMPLRHSDTNSIGWHPKEFNAWGFYKIKINKP